MSENAGMDRMWKENCYSRRLRRRELESWFLPLSLPEFAPVERMEVVDPSYREDITTQNIFESHCVLWTDLANLSKICGLEESWLMIYQVGACLTYTLQWVANVALPIFNITQCASKTQERTRET